MQVVKNVKVRFEKAKSGDVLVVVQLDLDDATCVKWYPKIDHMWRIMQALALADYLNSKKLSETDIRTFRLGRLDRKTANFLKGFIEILAE
jgi:hypothetical protein